MRIPHSGSGQPIKSRSIVDDSVGFSFMRKNPDASFLLGPHSIHVWEVAGDRPVSFCGMEHPHPVISLAAAESVKDPSMLCSACVLKNPRLSKALQRQA
jgi:hypothetical protein